MSARDHHRPVKFDPALFDQRIGGVDPAVLAEAAHVTAAAVLHRGRGHEDPEVRRRLVEFTDTEGLDGLAALWSEAPPVSLPGALWRLYALRSAVQADPVRLSRWFEAGRDTAQVSYVVAGVADPPRAARRWWSATGAGPLLRDPAALLRDQAAAPQTGERLGRPAVLPRVHDGACLVDLRCVPESRDHELTDAVAAALEEIR